MEILLTPDQESTIKHILNTAITEKGDRYLYLPFYLKEKGNGEYDRLRFDQLPEEVKDMLLRNQGIKLPTE